MISGYIYMPSPEANVVSKSLLLAHHVDCILRGASSEYTLVPWIWQATTRSFFFHLHGFWVQSRKFYFLKTSLSAFPEPTLTRVLVFAALIFFPDPLFNKVIIRRSLISF
jgi:hypothetical protein